MKYNVGLVAAASVVLACLFVFPASSVKAAADYLGAQNWFQHLPETDRHSIGIMLIATGRYNGMSTGEFNHRIYNGILGFQRFRSSVPNGVLAEPAKRQLFTEGAQFLKSIGLREASHPLVSAKLYIPFKLIETQARTPRGMAYEGTDASVDFSYFPRIELSLQDLFGRLASAGQSRKITYKLLRPDFFVVSGDSASRHFYSRYQVAPDGIVGFTFSWNDLAAEGHGSRIAVLMSNLFFVSMAPQVASAITDNQSQLSLALSKGQSWLVLASREKLNDAVALASNNNSSTVRVIRSTNGWFAVVDGPIATDVGRARIQAGGPYLGAYLSQGERFAEIVWRHPKQVATAVPTHKAVVASTGSSVFIASENYLITNEHVVSGCASLNAVGIGRVIAVAHDKSNDLALLKSDTKIASDPLPITSGAARLGEEVVAIGYPLQGILGGLNVTNGIVSGLSGLGNNSTELQFTAPVQPGNSGGALLDRSGALVGIVSSKLNDKIAFGSGGFVPQGVNFAVRSEVVRTFLSAQSVQPVVAGDKAQKSIEDIAQLARKSVFPIECMK